MEMQPSQFIIFDDLIPHRSPANQLGKRRMGIGMRVTVPGVKIDKSRLFHEFGVLLVYGEDKYRVNDICEPPDIIALKFFCKDLNILLSLA